MFLDWAFKPRSLNNDFLSFLTSKAAVTCMALVIAPPVLWLTFTWADRAAAAEDSTDNKMSTESVSSIYPDRPIRPLPKRRMRDRLSSEELDTINYPPSPQNNVPLFDYPYNLRAEAGEGRGEASNVVGRENTVELAQESSLRRSGLGGGGGSSNEHGYALRTPPRQSHGRHTIPQPPPSTASSADGYDSFENTNNKKKRKIPIAGENMLNGSHVLSDPSLMGMPSPPTTGDEGPGDPTLATPHAYYQSIPGNASAQGISGPGRGRYGRHRNGRSPMRTISDTNVGLPKNPKLRSGSQYPGSPAAHSNILSSVPGENSGIISNAIASAEKLSAPHGQENISLLQQQASSRATPTSAQFTFTFDSPVPGSVSWPGSESLRPHMAVPPQTSLPGDHRDPYPGGTARATETSQPHLGTSASGNVATNGSKPVVSATQKKAKRRPGSPLLQAARERRQQTEYQNYHHPPAPQDVWVCEFCEYERIFGRPPVALIRRYEIKDRRRRQEEAERRRLLEKAKMKSRKGKKVSNKLPAKNNNNTQERAPAPPSGYQAPHMDNQPSQETQSEEFDEDEYYEEDVHDDAYIPVSDAQDALSHGPTSSHDDDGPGGGSTRDARVPVG
ncbi:hypothetical protein PG994_007740 [Apiospora phragmitis]|uniref:Uncharacterized protein n=1 Tax=Apiospora phragmitis TaxID=2905665 RepID=A0ABR1UR33_9PEZI